MQSPGRWLSSAVSTYSQNSTGSLSPSSRETQAIRECSDGSDCIQVESRVVLPKPAGAETSVSGRSKLLLSNSVKRGRGISACKEEGIKNFVARSWSWNNGDWSMIVSLAYVARLLSYDWFLYHHLSLLFYDILTLLGNWLLFCKPIEVI